MMYGAFKLFIGFRWSSCLISIIPPHKEVVGGVYWFHSVRPSVCPSVCPASLVCPVALVGSISYLYILSSNFRRCVTCKVYCQILKICTFGSIFKICYFDFVLFWLIWCESLVWVIMGRQGVISECRHSSCSSFSLSCHVFAQFHRLINFVGLIFRELFWEINVNWISKEGVMIMWKSFPWNLQHFFLLLQLFDSYD